MDTNDPTWWVLCCDGYHFFKKLLAARPSAISSCPTDAGLVGLFWCREMPQSHTEHAPEWYHHSVSSFCLSEVFFSCSTSDWSATISLRDSYFMWRCVTVGVSTEPSWPVPLCHISHIQNHIKHELVLPYEDVLWKGFNTVPFWNTVDMCVSLNGTLQSTKDLGQCPTLTSIIHVWFPWGPFSFGPCTAVQWLIDSSR